MSEQDQPLHVYHYIHCKKENCKILLSKCRQCKYHRFGGKGQVYCGIPQAGGVATS